MNLRSETSVVRNESVVKPCSTGSLNPNQEDCFTSAACHSPDPLIQATGQLQWNSYIPYQQNVAGQRWGSGVLISPDLFITAGHCFDKSSNKKGWTTPQLFNGLPLEPFQFAPLLAVNFNYQRRSCMNIPTDKPEYNEESFAIESLVEYRNGGLDFAVVKLAGSPGQKYGYVGLDFIEANSWQEILIPQHPRGYEKKVEYGYALRAPDSPRDLLHNANSDGGASGAGISLRYFSGSRSIIGVHTNGIEDEKKLNGGVSINAIYKVSQLVNGMLLFKKGSIPRPLSNNTHPPMQQQQQQKNNEINWTPFIIFGVGVGLIFLILALKDNKKRIEAGPSLVPSSRMKVN